MKKESFFTNRFVIVLSAMLCCALWGSATPFIKIGYEHILPNKNVPSTILFAGIRFMLAGVLTIVLYSIARCKFLIPKKENMNKILTVSCFQTIIQYIFFYIGLANTSGVKGTVLSGSNAFFSLLVACLIFKQEKLTLKKLVACVIGFAGVILINLNGLDFNMNLLGDGFVIFSSISYGVSSVLMKKYSQYEDPVIISGYQFAIGGLIMTVAGILIGGRISIETPVALAIMVYLAFLSAIAYALWGVLLKHNPVSKITVFSFMIPVFGVILSNLMLSEASNVSPINIIITLVLISAGILMLNYRKEQG